MIPYGTIEQNAALSATLVDATAVYPATAIGLSHHLYNDAQLRAGPHSSYKSFPMDREEALEIISQSLTDRQIQEVNTDFGLAIPPRPPGARFAYSEALAQGHIQGHSVRYQRLASQDLAFSPEVNAGIQELGSTEMKVAFGKVISPSLRAHTILYTIPEGGRIEDAAAREASATARFDALPADRQNELLEMMASMLHAHIIDPATVQRMQALSLTAERIIERAEFVSLANSPDQMIAASAKLELIHHDATTRRLDLNDRLTNIPEEKPAGRQAGTATGTQGTVPQSVVGKTPARGEARGA